LFSNVLSIDLILEIKEMAGNFFNSTVSGFDFKNFHITGENTNNKSANG
jgi:hypothetical protein